MEFNAIRSVNYERPKLHHQTLKNSSFKQLLLFDNETAERGQVVGHFTIIRSQGNLDIYGFSIPLYPKGNEILFVLGDDINLNRTNY